MYLDPIEAQLAGRKEGVQASIDLLEDNIKYCSPFDGSVSVLRNLKAKLEALRDGYGPKNAQMATVFQTLPLDGQRWRHNKTKRVALIVSATDNQILYRYVNRNPSARSVQTVNVYPKDFIKKFSIVDKAKP